MTPLQQLDGTVIEYKLAPNMVVFSHGFGVRRDGRGMFAEICRNLPDGYGYVLFDYNEIDDENHTVRLGDFSEQTKRLNTILAWTFEQAGVQSISLVAHSMGCIVAALTQPADLRAVILLAPPTSIGERTRRHFTTKKGAEKQDDMWLVPRSDGTISIIPESLFDQYEQVDAMAALKTFAARHPYTLIAAGADEVLPDADYGSFAANENVQFVNIADATHDFEGDARPQLIEVVNTALHKK